jgi:uncharacterized protein involved in exopolysaccharide biosynthesis
MEHTKPTFDESSDVAVREQTASGQEVSLLDMLIVLAKRKRLIAGTTVAAALLALIVCFLIPDRYKATATLLPPQQQQSLASTMASQLSSGVAVIGALAGKDLGGLKNPSDLYVGLLKSRSVADALVQRFALMDVYHRKQLSDARSRLEKATEIEAAKNGFITVSVEDKDRKRAAAIANGYVEELRRLTSTIAVSEAGQRRLFFEQQLRKAKDDLADAEIAYKETEEKTGVIHMDTQARATISAVASMRAQIATTQVRLQAMRSFATSQNPDVILLEQELAGRRTQLAELEKRQNGGPGNLQMSAGVIPEAGLQYIRRLRDLKYYEAIFELLARQFEAAKLDEAREGAVIQVVDQAVEPDKKSAPFRTLIVLAFAFAGFVISALWVFCAEALSAARQDPEQSEQISKLSQLLKDPLVRIMR